MLFRKDIQALRAIAVLLVVFCHLGIPGFSAGFIGVDLFFVVSGYVISGILYTEKVESGHVNLIRFYARRSKRLLPAFLCMLIVVAALCCLLYAPQDQMRQITHAIPATLWVSNIQLAFSAASYFEPDAQINLFLHTWSLGVEEQFYLVWPVVFFFLIDLQRKNNKNQHQLIVNIALLAFASLIFSIWLTYAYPLQSYYQTPSRLWQFFLGALAFLLTKYLQNRDRFIGLSIVMPYCGMACVALSLLLVSNQVSYPGYQAVLPTLGVFFVLLGSQSHKHSVLVRWFDWPILQWLGNRSYSIYLWHWPIWLILSSFQSQITAMTWFFALIVIIFIAAFSFRLVEQPIRVAKTSMKDSAILVGAFAFIASAILVEQYWFEKADKWNGKILEAVENKFMHDLPILYKMGCETDIDSADVARCDLGVAQTGSPSVVLWGDSIAAQWFPAFASIYKLNDYAWRVYTKSACSFVDASVFYSKLNRIYDECDSYRTKVIELITQNSPDILILGTALEGFSEEEWLNGSRAIFERFKNTNTKIYVFRPTPQLFNDPMQCFSRQLWIKQFFPVEHLCDHMQSTHVEINNRVTQILLTAIKPYQNVKLIDLNSYICPNGMCALKNKQVVTFRDTQHLTATYVESLTSILIDKL